MAPYLRRDVSGVAEVRSAGLLASTGLTGANARIVVDRDRVRTAAVFRMGFLSTGDRAKFRPYNS